MTDSRLVKSSLATHVKIEQESVPLRAPQDKQDETRKCHSPKFQKPTSILPNQKTFDKSMKSQQVNKQVKGVPSISIKKANEKHQQQ